MIGLPRLPFPATRELPALAAALAAAGLAHALHVKLAFVVGPLLATATFAVCGRPVFAPTAGRKAGQLVIGATIGLRITLPVLLGAMVWLPVIAAAACGTVLLSALATAPMAHAAGIDRKTAFFAMLPGGLAEMANTGASVGAAAEPIALTQALRVALVVLLLPPVVVALGHDGGIVGQGLLPPLGSSETLLILAMAPLGVLAMRAIRLNNPWMLGALFSTVILSASAGVTGTMPLPVFYAGQVFLGLAIGARFTRESLRRLKRVALVSTLLIIAVAAALVGVAAALSSLLPLDFATLVLGISPGGMAEMAATAQTLHLDVALVTTFHVIRAVLVNGFSVQLWTLYRRVIGTP